MRTTRILFLLSFVLAGTLAYATPTAVRAASLSLSSDPAKLSITQEGIYRVTGQDLANAGYTTIDPTQLQLAYSGQAVPIFVSTSGPSFGASDYVEFYAHPVNNTYTSTNVYLLSDNVASPLRAAAGSFGSPTSPATTGSESFHDLRRDAFGYTSNLPAAPYTVSTAWPSDGDGHWYEKRQVLCNTTSPACNTTSATTTISSLPIQNVPSTTNGPTDCSITLPIYGLAAAGNGPFTHSVALSVTDGSGSAHALNNGQPFTWSSSSANPKGAPDLYTVNSIFPCSYLSGSASPQLSMTSTLQSGTTNEILYYMGYHIDYVQQLCAQSNTLLWNTLKSPAKDGTGAVTNDGYTISGFTAGSTVNLWAVNPDGTAMRYSGPASSTLGACASGGGLSFTDTFSTNKTYVATVTPLTLSAGAIQPLDTTDLLSGAAGGTTAKYLIISYAGFLSGVGPDYCASTSNQPLCQLAASHAGLTSKIVKVNTIYDKYAFGQIDPEAIRTYITYAHDNLGTQYVVLAGGDTQDYHNYTNCKPAGIYDCTSFAPFNKGNISPVPFLYFNSEFTGAIPTDNLYAVPATSTSASPDVAIGRLPAFDLSQLQLMVNKSTKWSPATLGYANTAAFGASDGEGTTLTDRQSETQLFDSGSDGMIAKLPSTTSVQKYYLDGVLADDQTTQSNWIAALNAGKQIVNYNGHGSYQLLGRNTNPGLYTTTNAQQISNGGKPSMFFAWGCQLANFIAPNTPSMYLTLLNAQYNGQLAGATLAVGSTGQDLAEPQDELAGGLPNPPATGQKPYFFGYLTQGLSVGVAMEKAKQDLLVDYGTDQSHVDVVYSYTVLGDPALTLGGSQPTVAHVSRFQAAASHHGVTLNWKAVTSQQIAGYRVQRHTATNRYATISRLLTVNHYVDLQGHSGDHYRLQVIGRHGEVLSTTLTRAH